MLRVNAGLALALACDRPDLLVPIIYIRLWTAEFVPQAHADNVRESPGYPGHLLETLDPHVGIEVLVPEESVTVVETATPTGRGYVVVEYDHHTATLEHRQHRL